MLTFRVSLKLFYLMLSLMLVLLFSFIGWPGRRRSTVAPSNRPDHLVSLSRPFGKPGPGGVPNGNLPNGTPSFGDDSVFDERDDPEGLSSGWLRFLSNDGGHLREQR